MCLVPLNRFPTISRTPIEVFKILKRVDSKSLLTPFFDMQVEIGVSIKAKESWVKHFSTRRTIDGTGVHAFQNPYFAMMDKYDMEYCYRGVHYEIYKGIIPPWTFYWIGNNGDIAAEKIIIKGRF